MTGSALAGRLRRVVAWRPARRGGHVAEIRCRYCGQWRSARQFRRRALGCRRCIGNG